MSWVPLAWLMFASSVGLYLCVRRASLNGVPAVFNNLATLAGPATLFGTITAVHAPSLHITAAQVAILVATGIAFSYAPGAWAMKSVELAPNAGYSLIISKSYVVVTAALAVPFLGASLSWTGAVAIAVIVLSSAAIMVRRRADEHVRGGSWIPLALLALVGWAGLSLTAKYLFDEGMSPVTLLGSVAVVGTVCIALEVRICRPAMASVRSHYRALLGIAALSASFNYFFFEALGVAPNVGYVNATNAASIGAVAVCSVPLFHDDFSRRRMVGVAGMVGGLALLFLGS